MQQAQTDRILDLEQSSIKVETEIETHTEEVASRLEEDFEPIYTTREDGQKPDFRTTLTALREKLRHSREKLVAAEKRQIDLVKQAVELRDERQELTGSLYDDFSSMRRSVEELFRGRGRDGNKASAFVLAGIQGPTAQTPAKLLRQVDLAVDHLRRPGLVFPRPRFGGTVLRPGHLALALEPLAMRMHRVLASLRGVGSEMNGARKERKRAIESHKATFLWVARAAEAYFHLAGEHELAERIRPSARRQGRRAQEVAETGTDGPEAGASLDGGIPDGGLGGDDAVDAASAETAAAGTAAAETPALGSETPAVTPPTESDPGSPSDV